MNVLLLMTTGMSLKRWNELGQLSRELNIYQKLGQKIGHIYIFSYGKNEEKYVRNYPNISVISKFKWFPVLKRGNRFLEPFYQHLSITLRNKLFEQMDIIKTNQFYGSDFGIKIKKKFDCKLIIRMGYYYTSDKKLFNKEKVYKKQIRKERKYFSKADSIIVTTLKDKEFISKTYKLNKNVVNYIPNYIETDIFKPLDLEKEYDILFIGRLNEVKNLRSLLEAVIGKNLKLLFIGRGKLKKDLLHFARSNNIDLNIVDRVENKELPLFYNRTRIFILPSFHEGNPKTLLEAMSCGCVCIGTDVNGINNIIQHRVNGFLCETDSKSIKKAISEVYENKNLQKTISQEARNTILENFALEKNLQTEIDIYENL